MLIGFFYKLKNKIQERRGVDVGFLRRTLMVYVVIFVLWGLYRLLLRFPIVVEEVVFKPIIFLLPVLSMLEREDKKGREVFKVLGFRRSGIFTSLYYGLVLGLFFALTVRLRSFVFFQDVGLGSFSVSFSSLLNVLPVSLATALWEQMLFSGFFLLRFQRIFSNEWQSVGFTSFLFVFLHLPILLLQSEFDMIIIIIQLLLLFLVSFGNAVLMLRTRNILAPILSHSFWALALGLLV